MSVSVRRTANTLTAIALLVCVAVGCTPSAQPTRAPTATGFATEQEAFAAAEATYRAYVDALNEVDLADPGTFERATDWTTGPLNDADRKSFSEYHADEIQLVGQFAVALVAPRTWDRETGGVEIDTCLDISATDFLDAQGASTVPLDRPAVLALRISLVPDRTSTGLALYDSSTRKGDPAC